MSWVLLQIKGSRSLYQDQHASSYSQPPPASQSLQTDGWELGNKISPSILLVITILAAIFFVFGLLHLLVRLLLRPEIREAEDAENVTALQGQLQQLFHLHDSGVDQSFIDTLPVFYYKSIIGVKDPFDCAVCLSEFEPLDRLRLLPKCSHAFHMECIETWLLSHSTCPLCRACLLSDLSSNFYYPPILQVLESGNESSREITGVRDAASALRSNSRETIDFVSNRFDLGDKSLESGRNDDAKVDTGEMIIPVKLGKFKNSESGESSSHTRGNSVITDSEESNVDPRRCLSMGSFGYVVDDGSMLHVAVNLKSSSRRGNKNSLPPLFPGHRAVMSECDFGSKRTLKLESIKIAEESKFNAGAGWNSGNPVRKKKEESFSVSKIWLRGQRQRRGDMEEDSSGRRAVSFRFPISRDNAAITEKSGNAEDGYDFVNSLQEKTPSFARRTLLWLVGWQNKIVHGPSPTPNV